jgi:hypothetical protein
MLAEFWRATTMKKLVVLAAFAFCMVTAHQAVACDMGAITAHVAATVMACQTSSCATDKSAAQRPTGCTGQNCAEPEHATPKVACDIGNCVTDQSTSPSLVTIAECAGNSC